MPNLKINPTLQDFQNYIRELEEERGFADQSARDKCLLLGEEIGELFKCVRKAQGFPVDHSSDFKAVSEEIADIFIYLCSIANRYDIDLEMAFRQKEEQNKNRIWKPAAIQKTPFPRETQ